MKPSDHLTPVRTPDAADSPISQSDAAQAMLTGKRQMIWSKLAAGMSDWLQAETSSPAVRHARLGLESLNERILPSTTPVPTQLNSSSQPTIEHYTENVTVNFHESPAGELANNSHITVTDIGNIGVESGGSSRISVTVDGALQTGANGGHLVTHLPVGTFVESVTVRGSGSGSINFGDGYIPLHGGEETIAVGKEIPNVIILVNGAAAYQLTGITVVKDRTREVVLQPAIHESNALLTLEASLSQAQQDHDTAQATLDDLLAHPQTVTQQVVTTVPVTFSETPAKQLANNELITVTGIGKIGVQSGGSSRISVTADGALQTGIDGGHLVTSLPAGTIVESVTVNGSGPAKINFGDYYRTLSGGAETIAVGKEIPNIIILVNGGASYKLTQVALRKQQAVEAQSPAYLAAVEDARTRVAELETSIARLTEEYAVLQAAEIAAMEQVSGMQTDIARAAASLAQSNSMEIHPAITRVTFETLGNNELPRVTTAMLGDAGNVQIEQAGIKALRVVDGGIQAGADGKDHVSLMFLDGEKFVTSVEVAHLPGTSGDGRLAFSTENSPTIYIPIGSGGTIAINQLVRSLAIVSSGNSADRLMAVNIENAQSVDRVFVQGWETIENPLQTAVNTGSSIAFETAGEAYRGTLNVYKTNPSPSKYSLLEVKTLSGNAQIAQVGYLHSQGFSAIPSEYYTLVSPRVVILHPGAPTHVVLSIEGTGQYEVLSKAGNDAIDSVRPPTGTTLQTDYLGLYTQTAEHPGFVEMVDAPLNSKIQHVMMGASRFVSKVENIGLTAGQVIAKIYAGFSGTSQDPMVGSYSTSLQSMQSKALVTNVTSPDPGVEERNKKPLLVTVVLTLPDGTEKKDVYALNREAMHAMDSRSSDGNGSFTYAPVPLTEEEQVRLGRIQQRIATAANEGKPIEVTWTASDGADRSFIISASTPSEAIERVEALTEDLLTLEEGQVEEVTFTAKANSTIDANAALLSPGQLPVNQNLGILTPRSMSLMRPLAKNGETYTYGFQVKDMTLLAGTFLSDTAVENTKLIIRNTDTGEIVLKLSASAENLISVRQSLFPGNYTLMFISPSAMNGSLPTGNHYGLAAEVMPSGSKIEGVVTLNGKWMPVNLSLAVFDQVTGKRKENYSDPLFPKIDLSKSAWIVVHGRTDNPDNDAMTELAKSLSKKGQQVIFLDWQRGAADNSSLQPLHGSTWIETTGKWAAKTLQALGFQGTDINLVGHSWGTYVSYELAKRLHDSGKIVNTLVALDPAQDSQILDGHYDISKVHFDAVAAHSLAFHSSIFGSENVANTAQNSFKVQIPEGYEGHSYMPGSTLPAVDDYLDATQEHNFAVTLFSSLITDDATDPLSSHFQLNHLSLADLPEVKKVAGFEGTITIGAMQSEYSGGGTWWKAIPKLVTYTSTQTNQGIGDSAIIDSVIKSANCFSSFFSMSSLFLLLLIPFIWLGNLTLWTLGYTVNSNDIQVAQRIVEEGRDASHCNNIRFFDLMGPTVESKQKGCIYEVAKLRHDPKTCESLMPSSYGLDCAGNAMKDDQCNFYGNFTVSWSDGNKSEQATLRECQISDSKRGLKGTQCCTIASVSFLQSFNDCSSLKNYQTMFDECQYHLAFKNKDPSACNLVADSNIQAGCIVSAEALKKNPKICPLCTPPVENISDLPK